MNLSDYLRLNQLTRKEFSRRASVYPSMITRLLNKGIIPAARNLAKIIAATDGQVTFDDLVNFTRG